MSTSPRDRSPDMMNIPDISITTDTDSSNNRIPPDQLPTFRALRKLYKLQTKAKHHATYLGKCLTDKNPPNGLIKKTEPQIPSINITFMVKWERVHNEFGLILSTLLKDYWTHLVQELSDSIKQLEDDLFSNISNELQTHVKKLLDNTVTSLDNNLSKRRNNKSNTRINTNSWVRGASSNTRYGNRNRNYSPSERA